MSDTNKDAMAELMSEMRDEIKQLRQENQRLRNESEEEINPPAPDNDEIVGDFFQAKGYAKASERPKRSAIKYFRRHTDDTPFLEITANDALDFASNWSGENQPPKRATILNYLGSIKVLYDWMVMKKWGPDSNPIEVAREQYKSQNQSQIRRSGQHSGTVIQPEEYLELVRANMGARIKSVLVLAVKTGLRRKELVSLKIQDVDLDRKLVHNRSPKGVGDERIPKDHADQKFIDDECVSVLEDWFDKREKMLDRLAENGHEGRRGDGAKADSDWLYPNDAGEKLTPMTMSRWWQKATNKAEFRMRDEDDKLASQFEELTTHDARRCFTSWLNWNNCPRDIITALRGDADEDMVSLYTQHGEDKVREEYEDAMPQIGIF